MTDLPALSRREREVMDIIHADGEATATSVRERMTDPPSNAAVRSVLRILVSKGHLIYEQDGPRYVYKPKTPTGRVRDSALRHLLRTFYGGSVEGAMAALLELQDTKLSANERARLKELIDRAAEEGR